MDWKFLKIETPEEGICILTISHPQSLNALSRPVLEEMYRFVTDIPEGTAVLIIRGDGPKSFVAGADISQMAGFDAEHGLDFGRFGAEVFRRIEELPIPVIAAVNGYALGGGCELAMACDIRIASEKAKFGQPEVKLGIIPGFSGTYRLPKLVGQGYAKEMIYSGRTIDAAEALRIGLRPASTHATTWTRPRPWPPRTAHFPNALPPRTRRPVCRLSWPRARRSSRTDN